MQKDKSEDDSKDISSTKQDDNDSESQIESGSERKSNDGYEDSLYQPTSMSVMHPLTTNREESESSIE